MSTPKKNTPKAKPNEEFVFEAINYRLMFIGLAIITLGFALMYGRTDIFDTRKTVISPLVVVGGFSFLVYAILKKADGGASNQDEA